MLCENLKNLYYKLKSNSDCSVTDSLTRRCILELDDTGFADVIISVIGKNSSVNSFTPSKDLVLVIRLIKECNDDYCGNLLALNYIALTNTLYRDKIFSFFINKLHKIDIL